MRLLGSVCSLPVPFWIPPCSPFIPLSPFNFSSDTFMSKTSRLYSDPKTADAAANASQSNLDKLNGELQDVTRIMTKNMEELLWRGDSLDRAYSFSPTAYSFISPFLRLPC